MHAPSKKSRTGQDKTQVCSSAELSAKSSVEETEDPFLNEFNIQFANMALGPQQRTTFREMLLTVCPFWISHFKRKK